jgi:hypothetical protein
MLKSKMSGGGGSTAKADKKEARVAKKVDKLMNKEARQFAKSKEPLEGFFKSTSKFAKKAQKLTDKYNKKK